jgi:hypothetical protein
MPSAAPTAQAAPVIVAPKTVVQPVSLDDMSNDDFFAMIGQ